MSSSSTQSSTTNPATRSGAANAAGSKGPNNSQSTAEKQVEHTETPARDPKSIAPLQYAWFAGHVFTVVGTFIEILAYVTFQGHRQWSQIIYRTTFVVIVATYAISLNQKLKGQIPTFYALLPLESFQYGALASLWLISRGHLLKLIPYFVFSLLQASHFASTKLIAGTANAEKIDSEINKSAAKLEKIVSWNNIFLGLRLVLDFICIRSGAFVSLIAFGIFFRLRVEYSPGAAETVRELYVHVDKLLSNPKVPAKVQDVWKKVKWNIEHYEKHELKPAKPASSTSTASDNNNIASKKSKDPQSDLFLNGDKDKRQK
ncbi:hypothetical protein AWJ20_3050 [Sugiyamaella lignohabitans]|uniref:Endoplasmic reticulum protein n=1 Tax=Sugiyamaella lignohabitans TaxID=796027 RepID=A0A167FKQ1_9ASCO|nr:uncharacterized protein AWJ20_3050 [Sugiyamaella lignohabitans]ANB15423.1 hypothetical protein AWJ20_3050 [Sugiyamaella lignohabitans]